MAEHCSACADLKDYAAEVLNRGITRRICNSLQENNGFPDHPNHPDEHDNCDALDDLLSCLIGNLHERLPSFGICDWREFADELMRNLFVFQKAILCSKCGQWNKIEEQERQLEEQQRQIERLERIVSEVLRLLRPSGAWTGTTDMSGHFAVNLTGQPSHPEGSRNRQNIATGNINLFGNQGANNTDGDRFIRTNRVENNSEDIRGGLR